MFSKSTIKYIQSLQHKKFRDAEDAFVAEGPKLVNELLEGKIFGCKAVYALVEWVEVQERSMLEILGDRLEVIKDFELEKVAGLSKPNKVVAVFEKKQINTQPKITGKLTLVLDDIQDPGNLGTIIRIADWFGIQNIICSQQTADMYNPKVVQSTMASLQRVNLIYTDVLQWIQSKPQIKKYAAALNGKPLKKYTSVNEGIVVIGNESKGISNEILKTVDEMVTIPRIGDAESLNAAVATGIILYEMTR